MAFAHLTLATRDVERSAAFFLEAFGWGRIPRPGNVGCEAAWLQIAPGQELHLLRVDDFSASAFECEFGRHLAVERPAAEFPALKRRLSGLGAELIDPIRETPFERFFFRDPNGYVFEVVDCGRCAETPGP
jgi:catechol 2,3-dioxygenase-like lactoylglutathione lyase family enzyme